MFCRVSAMHAAVATEHLRQSVPSPCAETMASMPPVTVHFFVRNAESGEFEDDGKPVTFRDEGVGETPAIVRARGYAERWVARAPDERSVEIR
jgi:hypothetical protein